jgi:MFS family permease
VFDPRQAGRAFRNRGVRLASLGYFGHMWELYAMWSWFLVFAGDELYADRTDAALVTFAVIAVGGVGCLAGGIAGDRVGRPETTAACMAVSGLCALSIGFVPHGLALAIALVWGFSVVADSAQFSTLVTEHADQAYVGTALTLQLAVGFTLTVATIWLIPYLVDAAGWGWACAFLAVAGSRTGQRAQGGGDRVGIDFDRRARAGCPLRRELERVGLAHDRFIAPALDPRRQREQVQQHDELA